MGGIFEIIRGALFVLEREHPSVSWSIVGIFSVSVLAGLLYVILSH